MVKHFSGAKTEGMNYHIKPTQEKQPVQTIIHFGTNDLRGNKNSDEITKEIVEFENSIKTGENNVVVSSIASRKDRFNNKAKKINENSKDIREEHNLQLMQHHNINPLRHINAKGLHLNNYGDKQLTRNFTSFIENG